MLARQWPFPQCRTNRRDNRRRFRHPARTVFATGHLAVIRPCHSDPVVLQHCQIALRGRMAPHADIHGRSDENGSACCQSDGGQGIIGKTMGIINRIIVGIAMCCQSGGHACCLAHT